GAAEQPGAGADEEQREGVAGAPSLQGLQHLADGLAIVIGGAARGARLLDRLEGRTIGSRTGLERCGGKIRRRRRQAGRHRAFVEGAAVFRALFADVEGFLDGRKRDFGGIFDLLGSVRHVQSKPSHYLRVGEPAIVPTQARSRCPQAERKRPPRRLVRYIHKHPMGRVVRMKCLRLILS
ncbi:hypothetical protein chiPu_0029804, partial [Chiloscyllium punctatum]|nr:hypothetical protein [Chiloscyllium punctatum]